MSELTDFVYKVQDRFYFDVENYTEGGVPLSIHYEDGDTIKWKWENQKLMGTIRQEGYDSSLFSIENVVALT